MNKLIIGGHRGCTTEPENTIKAFKKALETNVDLIELDVRLTKDKVPVVIHDTTVNRTTNGRGRVAELTLAEIKKLDAGDGQQIPTLQEVINFVKGKTKLLIEVKTYATIKPVAKLIKDNEIVDSTIVASFGHIVAKYFKKALPQIKTGVLVVALPVNPVKVVEDANADYLFSFHETLLAGSIIYKREIKRANKKNIQVFACDVDDKYALAADELKQLVKMGVNGIITNNPAAAIKHLEKKRKSILW
jgi:glycerophosphoryl diester phosphodiesterase